MKLKDILNEGKVIQGNFGKGSKSSQKTKTVELTGIQAFGSRQMNIIHDAGITLMEKPSDWEDLDYAESQTKYKLIDEVKLKKIQKELKASGYELKTYSGKDVFGHTDVRPSRGPLAHVAKMPEEKMFIIQFSNSKYLCDSTGARSYIRNWARIK